MVVIRNGDAMKRFWLAVLFVVACTHYINAQVAEKPDASLEKDWQDCVTILRMDEWNTEAFNKMALNRVKLWKEAAERADTKGQVLYAMCLLEGASTPENKSEAMKLFLKAADAGNAVAMANLANDCMVKKDYQAGFAWYKKSAELGGPGGMTRLFSCYVKGVGTTVEHAEAVRWLKKAADLGIPWEFATMQQHWRLDSMVLRKINQKQLSY